MLRSRGDSSGDGRGECRGGADSPHDSASLNREEGELVDHGVVLGRCGYDIARLKLVCALSWSSKNLSVMMSTPSCNILLMND